VEKDISSINKDLKYQKISWPVRNVFWVLMAGCLIFGLMGGFGDSQGMINKKHVSIGQNVIEYEPYLRVEKNGELKIFLNDSITNCVVGFNDSYIDKIKITEIIPEPDEVSLDDKHIYFKFKTSGKGTITFFQDPIRPGKHVVDFSLNGKKILLHQFIYF
jgi:hypothetical protein